MTDTVHNTPREISIKRGGRILVAIMVYLISLEVITLAVKTIDGRATTVTSVIWLALTIVCGFYLYRGKDWAKLLLTFRTTLGAVGGLYFTYLALKDPTVSFAGYMFILVLTILNGLAAYYLFFSSDLDAFLQSCKR